jgi:hypothetical protein
METVVTMHHTVLSIALASADSPGQPEWWQTVNGIIGIGIAIIFSGQLGVGILDLSFRDVLIALYWIILAATGWPILLDTLPALSINMPRFCKGESSDG